MDGTMSNTTAHSMSLGPLVSQFGGIFPGVLVVGDGGALACCVDVKII
jgi:hypothetical protein